MQIIPEPSHGRLAVVRYSFECAENEWHVRRLAISEVLGRPYRGDIEVVTEDVDVVAEELVGAEVVVGIDRDPGQRVLKGVVLDVEHHGIASGRAFLRVTFGPVLQLLERSVRSRIFQGKSVPEILEAVLMPLLSQRDRSMDAAALGSLDLAPRDYCVQYRETDLDFVHRLLEEEGLTYRFDQHLEDHETVVFLDGAAAFTEFRGIDGEAVVPVIHDREEEADVESIQRMSRRVRPTSPSVIQRDWDWRSSPATVHEEAAGPPEPREDRALEPLPAAELHEHGDHRLLDLDFQARARRKREALAVDDGILLGTSNVTGFSPGLELELDADEAHGRHRLVQVLHRGDAPEVDPFAQGQERQAAYRNEFRCIPAGRVFRPRRLTPRPVISGPQTAVVTGPPGEEIHTDEHGRIKVRMHWDRGDTPPEDASCWIRVAQSWGGPGWGSVFLPRVGMEVLVFFVDGDPDRPLCMGSVYNGENRLPYALPEERTKTTIKTRSSPGGDGFNELRFEDAAGSEQVFVHAQRDLDEVVRHDHSRSVGHHEVVSVGGDRAVSVEGSYSVQVRGQGEGGQKGAAPHYSVDVEDDARLHASKTVRVEAETSITLQCRDTIIELTPESITLRAGSGASMVLDVEALLRSKPGGTLALDAEGDVLGESAGGASVRLDESATARSKAGSRLLLADGAELAAAGTEAAPGATLKLDTDAEVQANAVCLASEAATLEMSTGATLNAIDIELSATTTTCTAAQALTLGGATVEISGVALATMTAALVKVN